ncbi:unnamed protein product [marine sediment metagenome]|uniref:Uncharacterized protein n=1 Tax=marine sediment metagenome TaxID=412755 RepID=X1PCY5_9ZZZZ
MFVSLTVSVIPSRCIKKRKFEKASPPIMIPRNINSVAERRFTICSLGSRGGEVITPSAGGSNVKKVRGMISPIRSIARTCTASIGIG